MLEMSDSDSDYVDIGEADETLGDGATDEVETAIASSGTGRGKDIEWLEVARYMDKTAYETYAFYLNIKKNFTMRRSRETDFSDNEHFTCKFSRKRGFLVCPLQYKVHFLTTSSEILVRSNGRCHLHQEDTTYTTEGPNLHWTQEQTNIVMEALKHDGSAKTVTRELRDGNVFSAGKFPSTSQINAKLAYCRSVLRKSIEIFDTFQLREKIAEKLEVPSEDTESYIAYHHVDDEDDSKDPHFCIIWTSKKLLARISDDFTQDDATYRLTWQGKVKK